MTRQPNEGEPTPALDPSEFPPPTYNWLSLVGCALGIVSITAGWLRERWCRDRTARPTGVGSVVSPFGLTSDRHTILVGVTLTSELLEKH